MLIKGIKQKVEGLRKKGRLITNCYMDTIIERAEKVWEGADSVLFSYDDHGVKRLIYFVLNAEQLKSLLMKPDTSEKEYVVEFLSRDRDENRKLMEDVGYRNIANMKRISNSDCTDILKDIFINDYRDDSVGAVAKADEAEEINQILWSVFDTNISHLESDEELRNSIKNGEVSIHRNENGIIDAILQIVEHPRKFYINQIYNGTEKKVIHAMFQERLMRYIQSGGKYAYAWVEEENIASIKFHQKYGMDHDGMWDLIYGSKKIKMG